LDFSHSEEESPSSAICNQMYLKKLESLRIEEFFYSQLYWMAVLVMNETRKSEKKIISNLLSFCMQLLNLEGTELAVEPYVI
jgi:hypothetical protein